MSLPTSLTLCMCYQLPIGRDLSNRHRTSMKNPYASLGVNVDMSVCEAHQLSSLHKELIHPLVKRIKQL